MEVDTFLISPRWEILQIIAKKPSSPMEIAEKLKTTISYISQQLRLLEAAGLVKKQKTGAVEKGKPRNIFSLSQEAVYLVMLSRDISTKKMLSLSGYRKAILKIWCIEEDALHYPLEKMFWKIEKYLEDIEEILIDLTKQKPEIIIVVSKRTIRPKIDSELRGYEIKHKIIIKEDFEKTASTDFYKIYSKNSPLTDKIEVKGGFKKDESE